MNNSGYKGLSKEELILRDHLAIDRTMLANERAFLAYIRTSLAVLITGLTLLKFFDQPILNILGWIMTFSGIIVFFFGFYRFKRISVNIHKIR